MGLRTRREFLRGTSAVATTWLVGCTEEARGIARTDPGGASEGRIRAHPGFDSGLAPTADAGSDARIVRPLRDAAIVDVRTLDGVVVDSGGAVCVPTTPDIEGPFYRPGIPVRSELDLYGDPGDRLSLSGRILDVECVPIEHAVVEIWNANAAGAYDTTTSERRYYGQVATAADGAYHFHTIYPANYLNGSQYRPRHVHMKVWLTTRAPDGAALLVNVLTTQIYFEGDPYNAIDPWWSRSRTIRLRTPTTGAHVGEWTVRGLVRPPAV